MISSLAVLIDGAILIGDAYLSLMLGNQLNEEPHQDYE